MKLPDGTEENVVLKILRDGLQQKKERLEENGCSCAPYCLSSGNFNSVGNLNCEKCKKLLAKEVKTIEECIPLVEQAIAEKERPS